MRLKLFGPDYKDQDPTKALEDFKKRVTAYESAYEPLGKWEEDNDLQYIQVRYPWYSRPVVFETNMSADDRRGPEDCPPST